MDILHLFGLGGGCFLEHWNADLMCLNILHIFKFLCQCVNYVKITATVKLEHGDYELFLPANVLKVTKYAALLLTS
jgi:hypothetical protein